MRFLRTEAIVPVIYQRCVNKGSLLLDGWFEQTLEYSLADRANVFRLLSTLVPGVYGFMVTTLTMILTTTRPP